jgi:hypothetical protein
LSSPGMIRGERQLLALRFRVSQKKILNAAIKAAERRGI